MSWQDLRLDLPPENLADIMLFLSTATRFRIRAPVLPGLGSSQCAARESLERRICEISLVHHPDPHY